MGIVEFLSFVKNSYGSPNKHVELEFCNEQRGFVENLMCAFPCRIVDFSSFVKNSYGSPNKHVELEFCNERRGFVENLMCAFSCRIVEFSSFVKNDLKKFHKYVLNLGNCRILVIRQKFIWVCFGVLAPFLKIWWYFGD